MYRVVQTLLQVLLQQLYNKVILFLLQGLCAPAVHVLLAQWAPPYERTKMVAITYSGKGYVINNSKPLK